MKDIEVLGYKISSDPRILDEINAITPEVGAKIEQFHKLALAGKRSSIAKFLEVIEKYPNTPHFKNYLSVLYGHLEDYDKMYETNHWIVAEHPDYLFGKLNMAHEYYNKEEYHKMPEVMGETMELKALYPNREVFHINEVITFMKTAVSYFAAIGDLEQAEIRVEVMEKIGANSPDMIIANNYLYQARMRAFSERKLEEKKIRISVETKEQEIKENTKAPIFIHKEIDWLYTNGLFIDEDKFNTILSLPRESLLKDLELLLQDSIDRFGYFLDIAENEEWDEERFSFVVHAIFILGEIKAIESIDSIFNVLCQSPEYSDLYLSDFKTECFWEPIYKILENNLEICKQFMFRPGIDTYSKTVFQDMMVQLALHQPERRGEVLNWFKEVIVFFLESKFEDNVIDSELIGLLVCCLIEIEGKELLDDIIPLFEKGIVAVGTCGTYSAVEKAFKRPEKIEYKREILSAYLRYIEITSTWSGYTDEDSYFSGLEDSNNLYMPLKSEPKIGRNDPCPCGSGKKYKKCCLK